MLPHPARKVMKQGFTPVSQGDSHGPLGLALPNNILVQRRHNVPRLHVGRGRDLLEVDAAGVLDGNGRFGARCTNVPQGHKCR